MVKQLYPNTAGGSSSGERLRKMSIEILDDVWVVIIDKCNEYLAKLAKTPLDGTSKVQWVAGQQRYTNDVKSWAMNCRKSGMYNCVVQATLERMLRNHDFTLS